MIGVFDSGRGGENAAKLLHSKAPLCDMLLFTDTKNSPFGTKPPERLLRILEDGIRLLRYAGCERILLACCTMCTVLPWLSEEYKRGVEEIISPTARAAAEATKNGRIAIIATERTVRSRAFSLSLSGCGGIITAELAAQPLVSIAEMGVRECDLPYLDALAESIKRTEADTLILGCTHFSSLKSELGLRLPHLKLIDSADEGAKRISQAPECKRGTGKLLKIQTIDYK